jgi:hypothetical protein
MAKVGWCQHRQAVRLRQRILAFVNSDLGTHEPAIQQ